MILSVVVLFCHRAASCAFLLLPEEGLPVLLRLGAVDRLRAHAAKDLLVVARTNVSVGVSTRRGSAVGGRLVNTVRCAEGRILALDR